MSVCVCLAWGLSEGGCALIRLYLVQKCVSRVCSAKFLGTPAIDREWDKF